MLEVKCHDSAGASLYGGGEYMAILGIVGHCGNQNVKIGDPSLRKRFPELFDQVISLFLRQEELWPAQSADYFLNDLSRPPRKIRSRPLCLPQQGVSNTSINQGACIE